MNALRIAIAVEARKAAASRVFRTVTALLLAGLAALTGSLVLAVQSGNAQVAAQLGPLADLEGWPLLLGTVTQITAAGGLLAFGVAVSWIMAREFADGTVAGLFALPVPRATIAVAKLLVFAAWAAATGVGLTAVTALVGLLLGYGLPTADESGALLRILVLAVLSALLAVPAGWAATLGRGVLPGIGVTIGIVVVAQVGVLSGAGAWMPFAAPALWALDPAQVAPALLAPPVLVSVGFGAATAVAWARLQLDR